MIDPVSGRGGKTHLFCGRVRGERAESITKIEELNQFLQTGLY